MIPTLDALFTPEQKERLSAAVRLRTSCRSYRGAPDIAQRAALNYAAGRFSLPGARLELVNVPESAFTGTLLGMRRITGCTLAGCLILSGGEPNARLNAGILGEAFVLEATAMGLGTCWVTGSFRKKDIAVKTAPGEALLCVIAVGIPSAPLAAPAARHRKAPEQLCRGAWREWPEQLLQAAALVHEAPSAMNMQPWTLWVGTEGEFVLDTSDRAMLDAGIGLCHTELALTTPHTWHFGSRRGDPIAWAVTR